MTKYSQWVVLTNDDAAGAAGLDMAKYKAATGECREASSKMREALFDLKGHREKVAIEAKEYLKNAAICEKTFALAPAHSKLRGNEVSAGAAESGPMPIVPVKPPRR
jgi:hypothetical protein